MSQNFKHFKSAVGLHGNLWFMMFMFHTGALTCFLENIGDVCIQLFMIFFTCFYWFLCVKVFKFQRIWSGLRLWIFSPTSFGLPLKDFLTAKQFQLCKGKFGSKVLSAFQNGCFSRQNLLWYGYQCSECKAENPMTKGPNIWKLHVISFHFILTIHFNSYWISTTLFCRWHH